jgi:hypothetical protein
VVLVDSRIAFDQQVDIVNPRTRAHPGFAAARAALLAQLGVPAE